MKQNFDSLNSWKRKAKHRCIYLGTLKISLQICKDRTMDYFKSRRSIRNFSDREISADLISNIIEDAAKAPTCGNMQLYTVVASRTPEEVADMAKLHFNQPAATGAKIILTVCADFNRFTRWCKLNNADAAYDNFLSFTSAMTDAVILAQQIVTIAEMKGIGTCYLGTVTYNAPEISKLLELPELVVPVAAVALGYPAEEGTETERLPIEAIYHEGKYTSFSDEDIQNFFKVKEEFPGNTGFAAENGKDNLAQVFAEVRYPRSLNESVSSTLLDYLKARKFI